MVFTGDTFADGGDHIRKTLKAHSVNASFFFTGNFYREPSFGRLIRKLKKDGHYLGAHSDKHLLYCDWSKRDSLLVTQKEFTKDLLDNYAEMKKFGIQKEDAPYFLPPYEWYNRAIADWTTKAGLTLVNFSPGTISHADYTTPDMKNYRSAETIFDSIIKYESQEGMNGFILLIHIGTDPKRTNKLYSRLDELIKYLKDKQYKLVRIDDLLE